MTNISIEKLSEIPYLDRNAIAGRFLSSLTFYEGEWHFWIAVRQGSDEQLIKMQAWPAEALYFAKEAVEASDIYLPLIDFIGRIACFSEMQKPFAAICDDIQNLSTSLAKLDHLQRSKDRIPNGLARMAATEVEYVVLVCRSMFDLFQEFILKIWKNVSIIDTAVKKEKLRSSFARMILEGEKLSSSKDIAKRFGLPKEIADCYAYASDTFMALRRFRDNIVHHGSQMQHVFDGDDCFLIQSHLTPFPDMVLWSDDERRPNNLVPLLPAIETIIYRVMDILNRFCIVLSRCIKFPPPVVPEMYLFMRGYFTSFLIAAIESGARRSAVQPSA